MKNPMAESQSKRLDAKFPVQPRMTRMNTDSEVPAGTTDNRPPFQPWVADVMRTKPRSGERKRSVTPQSSSVPDGTRSVCARCPSDESLGYFRASLRDLDSDCSWEVVNHSELRILGLEQCQHVVCDIIT